MLTKQTLALTILTTLSIGMVEALAGIDHYLLLLTGFFYNFLFNGLIYLLAAFNTFSFPQAYYQPKGFELHGNFYEAFGVTYAIKLLKKVGAIKFAGRKSALEQLELSLRLAEKNHTICLGLALFTMAYSLAKGWWTMALSLLLFNVLLNFYPIIAQRYNRARVLAIKQRFSADR